MITMRYSVKIHKPEKLDYILKKEVELELAL